MRIERSALKEICSMPWLIFFRCYMASSMWSGKLFNFVANSMFPSDICHVGSTPRASQSSVVLQGQKCICRCDGRSYSGTRSTPLADGDGAFMHVEGSAHTVAGAVPVIQPRGPQGAPRQRVQSQPWSAWRKHGPATHPTPSASSPKSRPWSERRKHGPSTPSS